ncbi:MAG TPA: sigma 54-interacting transcriptional regulator [Phycisphaerae bacterium]|nr:sigma 54-interacting transcriptional regulator [Phycisphaerae bacterium]
MNSSSQIDTRLERMLSQTEDGVFVLDAERRYVLFNTACERLTGYKTSEVVGASCGKIGVTECRDEQGRSLEASLCPGWAVFKGDLPCARQRMRITTRDGRHRWVETHYTALRGAEGQPEGVIGVMRDITEAKAREDQWRDTTARLREELQSLRQRLRERYGFTEIVSRSPAMQPVFEKITAASNSGSPVLVIGEHGTGKETVARTIHNSGPAKEGPFVPVSCTGASRDVVEGELFGYPNHGADAPLAERIGAYAAAKGGTLFIDDVSAMPLVSQARLLRAMQERKYTAGDGSEQDVSNVRIIATTSRPTQDLITSGRLREDLAYRLSVISIELPPLRSRKEDIPVLVDLFVADFNRSGRRQVTEVEPGAWAALDGYHWPGNLRELHHVIEASLASGQGPVLKADEVRAALRNRDQANAAGGHQGTRLDGVLADVERRTILDALRQARGQRSRAAKIMGISRSRLYRRMDALGIVPKEQSL